MDLEAKVLALEVVVLALAQANPNKHEAFTHFSKMFPAMVRNLNESDADHPGLANDFAAECNLLSNYLK
jgi:hypothetical protein